MQSFNSWMLLGCLAHQTCQEIATCPHRELCFDAILIDLSNRPCLNSNNFLIYLTFNLLFSTLFFGIITCVQYIFPLFY